MDPWIVLVTSLLPDLKKLIALDPLGGLSDRAVDIVKELTKAKTPEAAKATLDAEPETDMDVRVQLAQLALERHQADLGAEAEATSADLDYNALQLNSTEGARETLKQLAKLNSPSAWTPSILSGLVVIGFFGAIALLMTGSFPETAGEPGSVTSPQIVNLLFGALATAFATVLNFWFGSSLGSRRKDATTATATAVQQFSELNERERSKDPPRSGPSGGGQEATGGGAVKTTDTDRPGGTVAGIATAIVDAAQASQRAWDIPASVCLAQFGLESAWGTRMPPGSNNPFGIKARAGEPFVAATTTEVRNGRRERVIAKFRKFQNFDEAFDRHGRLLGSSRYYAKAREHRRDPKEFAKALTGVYATDPAYGSKLIEIMDERNLYQFDVDVGTIGGIRATVNRMVRPA
ncbi:MULTISPECIES: glycoside hydrolase family 73 protein [unclassified Aureimonas]|uniref:glycoside hydrolase family 73 protein n=1 Tax=unclassified Aureimonas TaxID=2615206 RepID=UPI0006F3226B|nr:MULTISPECIES: glucosaminidase domain-containing protein [unclassified Aureimonas]KQT65866.1 hypothetical protein ASG62_21480 [Aureimonas sp. Leaf427]KQT78085.1 hypothetical protein ASG54_03440 [Aureimonas sp. Leaf460]